MNIVYNNFIYPHQILALTGYEYFNNLILTTQMKLRNDKMTDFNQATIKLVFDIGAFTQSELELTDIFDISKNTFTDSAIQVILDHLSNGMHKIGCGWTASSTHDFSEVIGRQEVEISMLGADDKEIDLGRTVDNLRFHTKAICRRLERLNFEATMIVRVHGFGKDDPTKLKMDPKGHLALRQDVTALTGSGRVVVMGENDKTPTNATSLPDGTPPVEVFSMQAKLNSKEFLKVDTLKCAAKSHLMAWYRDTCVHGSMWGVLIPP
jgi:hypothetical protein